MTPIEKRILSVLGSEVFLIFWILVIMSLAGKAVGLKQVAVAMAITTPIFIGCSILAFPSEEKEDDDNGD